MASSNVERHRSYENFRRSAVFRCRLGVHNLGPQDDDMSENHLTIYLLVGSDQCVRIDMLPAVSADHSNLRGRLVLRGHDYSLSSGIIEYADVDAIGCPTDFEADRETTGTPETRTVRDFITLLEERSLDTYRFVDLNGKSLGCRWWVSTALQLFRSSGYLAPDADLTQGRENKPSIQRLIAQQWDRSKPPRKLQIVPGLFSAQPSGRIGTSTLLQLLQATDPRALRALAAALEATHGDVMDKYDDVQATSKSTKAAGLRSIVGYANSKPWQPSIARDFSRASLQHLDRLSLSVQARYSRAHSWIRSAKQFRSSPQAQSYEGSIFTLYLAAVCDLSGLPDYNSDDDSE